MFPLSWNAEEPVNSMLSLNCKNYFRSNVDPCFCLWLVRACNGRCVAIHLREGASGGFTSQVGMTLLLLRTEFSGVESLSDIIDGDPPEPMRLGNQGSPSVWQARRPSVGETG